MVVGPGGKDSEDVAGSGIGKSDVADQDIARFAASARNCHDGVCCQAGLVREQGGILRLIESGTNVVGHAAVDAHISSDSGYRLYRVYGIERDARFSDDPTPRFDRNPRHRNAGRAKLALDPLHHRIYKIGKPLAGIRRQIADAEAAAEIEFQSCIAIFGLYVDDKLDGDAQGGEMGEVVVQLGTDVEVETPEIDMGRVEDGAHVGFSYGGVQGNAEFRVKTPRGDKSVRMTVDAGSDPIEHRDALSVSRSQFFDQDGFVKIVRDNPPHSTADRVIQFVGSLRVAMKNNTLRRDAGLKGCKEFASRNHVEAKSFVGDDPAHVEGLERLARVDGGGSGILIEEFGFDKPTALSDHRLGHHIERSAVPGGEFRRVDPVEVQCTFADFRARNHFYDAHDKGFYNISQRSLRP